MFAKATKKKQKARVALIGPAGSGKTYTALTVAKHLGTRIAVIDTERGSASKYAGDVADFDVCEPRTFAPRSYLEALKDAAGAGYDVVVIDSMSHAWEGEGGILDQVDKRGGRFEAWKDMSPQTRELIDAILTYPGHVVATMRTKTEWVVEENSKGKKEPRKIGLAPKFKDGLEYEFDVVGTLDEDNVLKITKSRAPGLSGQSIAKPGKQFADSLRAWLDDGVEAPPPAPKRQAAPQLVADCTTPDALREWCSANRAMVKEAGPRGLAKVEAHAATLRVGALVVRQWLGMSLEDEDGSMAEDPPGGV